MKNWLKDNIKKIFPLPEPIVHTWLRIRLVFIDFSSSIKNKVFYCADCSPKTIVYGNDTKIKTIDRKYWPFVTKVIREWEQDSSIMFLNANTLFSRILSKLKLGPIIYLRECWSATEINHPSSYGGPDDSREGLICTQYNKDPGVYGGHLYDSPDPKRIKYGRYVLLHEMGHLGVASTHPRLGTPCEGTTIMINPTSATAECQERMNNCLEQKGLYWGMCYGGMDKLGPYDKVFKEVYYPPNLTKRLVLTGAGNFTEFFVQYVLAETSNQLYQNNPQVKFLLRNLIPAIYLYYVEQPFSSIVISTAINLISEVISPFLIEKFQFTAAEKSGGQKRKKRGKKKYIQKEATLCLSSKTNQLIVRSDLMQGIMVGVSVLVLQTATVNDEIAPGFCLALIEGIVVGLTAVSAKLASKLVVRSIYSGYKMVVSFFSDNKQEQGHSQTLVPNSTDSFHLKIV